MIRPGGGGWGAVERVNGINGSNGINGVNGTNGVHGTDFNRVSASTGYQFEPRGSVHNWNQTAEGI